MTANKINILYIILCFILLAVTFQTSNAKTLEASDKENISLIITLSHDGESYKVLDANLIKGSIARKSLIMDKHDGVMTRSNIDNPFILRGILSSFSIEEGHQTQIKNESTFVIRSPDKEALKVFNVYKEKNVK
jgi:hypothetical protein